MKKGILRLWLMLMVFYQTETHEFFALPFFFHHYYETIDSQPNTSIWDFWKDHYLENSHQESEHQKLPFKAHFYTLFTHFIPSDLSPLKITFIHSDGFKIPIFLEKTFLSLFIDTIWQPPKHV
ncbi:MAG: hypothetical protein KatS3mg035_0126 [Bacteroidia bacterium]|jgi:hypothetical protein|nr:MAG: hypothetical protein KatS3mg035_0126 [Bacteroidia bacterium]